MSIAGVLAVSGRGRSDEPTALGDLMVSAALLTADPIQLLEELDREIRRDPNRACDIVQQAIAATTSAPEMVAVIAETAIIAAPEQMRLISQCVLAAAPDSLEVMQRLLERLDPGSFPGAGAKSSKSPKEGMMMAASEFHGDELEMSSKTLVEPLFPRNVEPVIPIIVAPKPSTQVDP